MQLVRAVVAVALVLAVALSGCSGPPGLERSDRGGGGSAGGDADGGTGSGSPDGGGGGPTATPPAAESQRRPMLLRFGLEDCSGVETLGRLDAGLVQATLPEGYTVLAEPATADGGSVVSVQLVWASCAGLRTPSAFVNGTVFGFASVRIEAPVDAAAADEHWYRLRMLSQDDLLASLWAAAGYDVYPGAYSDAATPGQSVPGVPAPEAREIRLGDYEVQGVTTLALADPAVLSAHYTEVEGGRLEWVGSFEVAAFRALGGTVTVATDDPLASAWSASTEPLAQRHLDSASWSGTDLWLRVPAGSP